jgi:adenine-specific DNA-methyltransferase
MPRPKGSTNKPKPEKKVTRYTYEDIKEPRTPETGHTPLLPAEEQVVTLPMDNGWSKAVVVGKLPEGDERPVVVDMDPAADPVLFWAGKRNRREVPVLPLQRNEIVSESRIAQIIERARKAAEEKSGAARQGHLFADLEKTLRESDRNKRVEFYTHEEGWKNKLICGDSLHVMESLLHYENLRGKVQMIYIDPPYGIKYDSNFQQRVDSTDNDDKDQADDVLTIKAFRDTWSLGVHSYLSYLEERLYLCRELLAETGSVFVQMGEENVHLVRALLDEVFGRAQFVATISFRTAPIQNTSTIQKLYDFILWYVRAKTQARINTLYRPRNQDEEEAVFDRTDHDGTRYKAAQLKRDDPVSLTKLRGLGRLTSDGRYFKRLPTDFPWIEIDSVWTDTVMSTYSKEKVYTVQTMAKVVERCLLLSTSPGDLVVDITCGSGTTAYCAEKWGRRWVTCDTSRVAINLARQRLLSEVFEPWKLRGSTPREGFEHEMCERVTQTTLAAGLEPEKVELLHLPKVDRGAIRVCGPLEVMSLGRYSVEDWKGYVVREVPADYGEPAKLENYIEVICRLYRKDAAIQGATGLVHAVAETEKEKIAISVGPLSGRVTGKQIHDAVQDAMASGILEVHVLGWAFEANVGEVKSALEKRGKVKVELIMIRPDTLAEGLKVTQPEMLFSPLALPDIDVHVAKNGKEKQVRVTLKGVALFDRKRRTTEYKQADSGYVSAWYLDEDYDGDCFVDCQMFFDFKKAPNIKAALKAEVDPEEFTLKLASEPFRVRGYKRIAVKVVDVYGNESTVVRDLA